MNLSAPIFSLKSKAKSLKKSKKLTMVEALNLIAQEEGYRSWSLLISQMKQFFPQKYDQVLDFLSPGDLNLVAAQTGVGKTSFVIGLLCQAIEQQRAKSFFFSLSVTHKDIANRIGTYNLNIGQNDDLFKLNYSNDICADYIINETKAEVQSDSLIIIDYLQLLDEKRTNPPLQDQIITLKDYAKQTGAKIIIISQLNRELEGRPDPKPTLKDIRLPNPLNIKLLNKIFLIFRQNKASNQATVLLAGKSEHTFQVGFDSEKIKFYDLSQRLEE